MRTVEVVAYDDRWPEMFREEAAKIREAVGGAVRDIHHIGSTAVPGMAAKPILDILVEVDRIESVDARCSRMESWATKRAAKTASPGGVTSAKEATSGPIMSMSFNRAATR